MRAVKPKPIDHELGPKLRTYWYMDVMIFLETKYDFDHRDVSGRRKHLDDWCKRHGGFQTTRQSSDGYHDDPDGANAAPPLEDFWLWCKAQFGLIEDDFQTIAMNLDQLLTEEHPQFVLKILQLMRKHFGSFIVVIS